MEKYLYDQRALAVIPWIPSLAPVEQQNSHQIQKSRKACTLFSLDHMQGIGVLKNILKLWYCIWQGEEIKTMDNFVIKT